MKLLPRVKNKLRGKTVPMLACAFLVGSAFAQTPSYTLQAAQGWNLLGNSIGTPIAVSSLFGDAGTIYMVWKWDASAANLAGSGWQIYTPQMSAADLATYAASKGYGILTTINPGEGFWVNTRVAASFGTQTGTAAKPALAAGWNLVATGSDVTPSAFNVSLSVTPPASGVVPTNVTTIWAWDNPTGKWYFYAPSLEAQGGTALADYNSSRGLLNFGTATRTLGKGTGFWVNISGVAADWLSSSTTSTSGNSGLTSVTADTRIVPAANLTKTTPAQTITLAPQPVPAAPTGTWQTTEALKVLNTTTFAPGLQLLAQFDSSAVLAATVVAGGSGYTANDILKVTGGTGGGPNSVMKLKVTTVSGTGAVTGVSVLYQGAYSTFPTNPISVTGGTGTGATFNLADSGLDAWTPPAHGTVFAVSDSMGYSGLLARDFNPIIHDWVANARPLADDPVPTMNAPKWQGIALIDSVTKMPIVQMHYPDLGASPAADATSTEAHGMGVSGDGKWFYINGQYNNASALNIINARTLKIDKVLSSSLHHGHIFTYGWPTKADGTPDPLYGKQLMLNTRGTSPFVLDPLDNNKVVKAIGVSDGFTGSSYPWVDYSGKWLFHVGSGGFGGEGGVTIYSLQNMKRVASVFTGSASFVMVEFSANGKYAYIANTDNAAIGQINISDPDPTKWFLVRTAAANAPGPYGLALNWYDTAIFAVGKGEGSANRGNTLGVAFAGDTLTGGNQFGVTGLGNVYLPGCIKPDHVLVNPDPALNEVWVSCNTSFENIVVTMGDDRRTIPGVVAGQSFDDLYKVKTYNVGTYNPLGNVPATLNGTSGGQHAGAFVKYRMGGVTWAGSVQYDIGGYKNEAFNTYSQKVFGAKNLVSLPAAKVLNYNATAGTFSLGVGWGKSVLVNGTTTYTPTGKSKTDLANGVSVTVTVGAVAADGTVTASSVNFN